MKSLSMAKSSSEPAGTTPACAACNCKRRRRIPSLYASFICRVYNILAIFAILLIPFHIHMIINPSSWDFIPGHYGGELESMASKIQKSVTFLPLKDLRYSSKALEGHTWFMSSTLDTHEKGEVQYQEFPSSNDTRILCLKGRDTHDGSRNSYALAWPQTLPPNATLFKALTFISYNHYDYHNIWHGLSAFIPFVAWHIKNECSSPPPERWVLYHWGELRTTVGPWLSSLMEATFGPDHSNIENFDSTGESETTCFEKAVVMRHNEGGMSSERRLRVYDLLRCKARIFCNLSLENKKGFIPVMRMTMLLRSGPRSFKNETAVIQVFTKACRQVNGCHLTVAYANNLSFCEQVKLMSLTDILVSPHGAQLTNMFLMDRNSSVMEFFPKGWLELAGIGQYVYHWLASWSGMDHRGAWRDPQGDTCPFPDHDPRCMSLYKNSKIGYNETYFHEWAMEVISDVKFRKAHQRSNKTRLPGSTSCPCQLS